MLSVNEVFEMLPGTEKDAVWINPGMTGIVTAIKPTKSRNNQPMFACVLKDATGSAEVTMTLFDECITTKGDKITVGDVLEIFGKGLRRTEYKGTQQISTGRATEIHKVGRSAHEPEQSRSETPNGGERSPGGGYHGTDSDPKGPGIFGGTVGMAMKESMALHTRGIEGEHLVNALCSPLFWAAVHETASDVIRISLALERGKLCPSVKDRNKTPEEAAEEEKERKEAAEKAEIERIEKEKKAAEEAAKSKGAGKGTKDKVDDDVPY